MDIKKWLRDLFAKHADETGSVSSLPDGKTIERLIEKTINQKPINHEDKDPENASDSEAGELSVQTADLSSPEVEGGDEGKEKQGDGCCPYRVKRNIVASIAEVKRFAAEHQLATEILKALLKILAEMALNAMKGKVSASTLMLLLNALNFDSAKDEAYREGERAGRNAKIEEEYFPTVDDNIPHFNGTFKPRPNQKEDIFTLARKA